MRILGELEPKPVFSYFEELCAIPHGSADTKRISDYCVNFAKEHGLSCRQDQYNNVIIFKPGTTGYENVKPVILQGHLDMVCEKEKDCDIDFAKDGLALGIKDGYVYAKGTTLGGDDGIAIAYALAILDSKDIPHPPIEAVFTVDEEIGMLGAAALDCNCLQSDRMLNIDSEEEGYLLVSCAGGVTATCHIPVQFKKENTRRNISESILMLSVTGLEGGHSGTEIDKGHANANQVLGRVLYAVSKKVSFCIVDIRGGLKDNAIPREAHAVISCREEDIDIISEILKEYNDILKNEYRISDKNIRLVSEKAGEVETYADNQVFDDITTNRVITALVNLPCGIVKMSRDIEGLVQTSLNLGILTTDKKEDGETEVQFSYSVRSSVKSEKEELVDRLQCLMNVLGGSVTCTGEYPAWEYKEASRLRELMVETYLEQYGEKPVIQAIHAGVECGLFAGKIQELDCVSFGPNIKDIHTPKERLDIESVGRVWKYLLRILEKMNMDSNSGNVKEM